MKQDRLIKVNERTILTRLLLGFLLCFLAVPAYAQEVSVNGTVRTSDDKPVPAAEIRIKGQSGTAARANAQGEFSLSASRRDILEVSMAGFQDQSIPVSSYGRSPQIEMNIILFSVLEQARSRDRVMVLDGSQDRELVTGAYSQMNFREVVDKPIINNMHKATGHLSGLMIYQSNGQPGNEAYRALIRGTRTLRSNNPVILVNGFERSMEFIDPNEIETITVLKDAAATAQYGLRGGNGIISVTTRRGEIGKVKLSFNASGGFKKDINRPHFLNSYDYARLYNEAMYNDYDDGSRTAAELAAFSPAYSPAALEKYRLASQGIYQNEMDRYLYPNNSWYDDYIKKSTWQQHYNLSASGGTNFAKYFVSVGYTTNEGAFNVDKKANDYNTNASMNIITLRTTLDIQATKMLTASVNISARQEKQTAPGGFSNYVSRIYQSFYRTPPNAFPVFNPDGSLGGNKDYSDNPYGLLNREGYSQYFIRSLDVDLTLRHTLDFITKGLAVSGTFAFDNWFDHRIDRSKNFEVWAIPTMTNPDGTLAFDPDGKYEKTGTDTQMASESGSYPTNYRTLAFKVNLDYQRTFGKHALYAFAGLNRREISSETTTNLPRQYLNINTRLSYAYDRKYIAEFTAGYEGSEQFPSSDRYGFFPAASLGWVLTNESFMPESNVLNFLKLRGSFGLTGNDDIGGYFTYLHRFQLNGTTQFGKNLPSSTSVRYQVWEESALAQSGVTWEKVRKGNIGIDAALFDNKLNVSVDGFFEKNRNIMVEPPLSLLLGTKVSLAPLGKVENKGLDMSFSFSDNIGSLGYRLSGNYTTYHDKVIENAERTPLEYYQTRKGRPIGQAWGFEAIGYFTQADIDNPKTPTQTQYGNVRPGDIMYKDQNGDGIINEYDAIYLGRQQNNNQASLMLDLNFKGFDISVQFVGQWGGSMALNNESAYEFYQNGGVMEHHLNRFNPQDPGAYSPHGMKFYKGDYPRLSLVNTVNNRQGSTFWRVPTDLLRLKSVEFGYTFNSEQLKKLRMNIIRLYISGYNLATWSKTSLVDVEANSGSGIIYPIQKIWSFGVRLNL